MSKQNNSLFKNLIDNCKNFKWNILYIIPIPDISRKKCFKFVTFRQSIFFFLLFFPYLDFHSLGEWITLSLIHVVMKCDVQ